MLSAAPPPAGQIARSVSAKPYELNACYPAENKARVRPLFAKKADLDFARPRPAKRTQFRVHPGLCATLSIPYSISKNPRPH